MSAEIDLTVNSHRGSLDVIEKTVWHEESGGEWAEAGGKHVLTIGTRGAGLIRFREHNGQVFSVVIGIGYGEKPWADVQVDLGRADTGTKLLPEYYSGRLSNEGHAEITRTDARGTTVKVTIGRSATHYGAYAVLEYS